MTVLEGEKRETSAKDKKDVEKQEISKRNITESKVDDNEELEKLKEKKPPSIKGSLVVFYFIYSSMFIVGWINLNSCPLNIMIPIYLIVTGFTGAITKFLSKIDNYYLYYFSLVLRVFYIIWHIYGSYCVYKEYQPNYNYENGPYCNRTAYLFAFWMLTLQYSSGIIFLILSGCYMLMRNDFNVNF